MTKTTASSKNLFTFNHINKTIVGTEHHFNQAGIPNSTAYKALMAAMELQPTYSLAPIASTKKVEKKQTYKGLDMGLMADYIRVFGNELAVFIYGKESLLWVVGAHHIRPYVRKLLYKSVI